MPGGLKENIEFYMGNSLRVDKSEGQSTVYIALDEYAKEKEDNLPDVFVNRKLGQKIIEF